ncbi:hypothetical protein DVH24_021454 [Malus domestica]|uniref:Uncharacterized protein n=1 Tax=Malus domestica TaxID=3750 RepID=A0A498K1Q5_MALDO|nr:hypothetical protein DVH24_021454 [Malus domestica]
MPISSSPFSSDRLLPLRLLPCKIRIPNPHPKMTRSVPVLFTRQILRAQPARLRKSRLRMSPILASSLGLNRIKMRSGPLLHESLFGFRGDKGSALA